MSKLFFGYPSTPPELLVDIRAGIGLHSEWRSSVEATSWENLSGSSEPIILDVISEIENSKFCFFDITIPNANVYYEVGYSFARSKIVTLLVNRSFQDGLNNQIDFGVFDTRRILTYENGTDLANLIKSAPDSKQSTHQASVVNDASPIFFLHHSAKNEFALSYFAEIKQQGLGLRHYDPVEERRFPLDRMIKEVSSSAGIFLSLIPSSLKDAFDHNLKAAILAGLADGFDVPKLLLKHTTFTAPFDIRDDVYEVVRRDDIGEPVRKFIPQINAKLSDLRHTPRDLDRSIISNIDLGASSAENEVSGLNQYFLETREYKRTQSGNTQLVIGRKGSGKTAIFWQIRNRARANRSNIVLDLRPEGYQLQKLGEVLSARFSEATFSHTLNVFWEYIIYLEIAHKILENDRKIYARDPNITERYIKIRENYENVDEFRESDFPERLLRLIQRIKSDLYAFIQEEGQKILTTPEITNLIYKTDFRRLRDDVLDYLSQKTKTHILFDNLDSGWTATGVSVHDIQIIRCLIDAGKKIERHGNKKNVDISMTVFIRDDVYSWLIDETGDRGKDTLVNITWSDKNLLKTLINSRLNASSEQLGLDPAISVNDIFKGSIDGEYTFEYILERCLRRPRSLIDLTERCLSNASLSGNTTIGPDETLRAVESYSIDMLRDLSFEIRDIFPDAEDVVYQFARRGNTIDRASVLKSIKRVVVDDKASKEVFEVLLWYGFLGVISENGAHTFIFDHGNDLRLLKAHAASNDNPLYCIHPLFKTALSLREDLLL
mgnify:CR=1 FL=1